MKVLEDFKVFIAAKSILEEAIESNLIYDVELNLNDKYEFQDGYLRWELCDDDFTYGEEAQFLKEFEDCEMYKVYSCTGEKYIAVFDKANKVEI